MIAGQVTDQYEAVVALSIVGAAGKTVHFDVVIDTGFNGWLSLPPTMIRELELTWSQRGLAYLADGSRRIYDLSEAEIVWDHRRQLILVDECDSMPMVGMQLLAGHEVWMDVRAHGRVEIRRSRRGPRNGRR